MVLRDRVPRRASLGGLVLASLLALAFLPGWSFERGAEEAPAPRKSGEEARKDAPGLPAEKGIPPEKAETCAKELEEIRKAFQAIPEDYRQVRSIQDLVRMTQECRDRCEKFLADCKGAQDIQEAQYMLGKLLLALSGVEWSIFADERTREGLDRKAVLQLRPEWSSAYFERIVGLAETALDRFEAGKPLRARCLDILCDALLQGGQPEIALERGRQLLREFPRYDRRAFAVQTVVRCITDLNRSPEGIAEGIALVRETMKESPDDPSTPLLYETLWQLQTYAGDLPALLRLVEEMQGDLRKRVNRPGIGKIEKDDCDRVLAFSGFRKGYVQFALGLFPEATGTFREHVESMGALHKEKGMIPPAYQVYWGRSQDNLKVLESAIGKPAPAELKKAVWLGERKPALDGKPLAILFRNSGDERSAPFLQAMDRYARSRRDACELVSISFYNSAAESQEARAADLLAEARSLGIECCLGIDPDAEKRSLFRAFQATVGSATFAIVDRNGNYVWFQQDPTERDVRFSTAILERIIGKKP